MVSNVFFPLFGVLAKLADKQALFVQRADNSIQWIKCRPTNTFYPLDKVIRSLNSWGQLYWAP